MNSCSTSPRARLHTALWCALPALLSLANTAQAEDIPTVVETDTLVVVGQHEALGEDVLTVPPGVELRRILEDTPFVLIRRGASSSSDLYVDGLKKSDITVTIDGERFTTACPNRMDTRVGQVNLMDIERIDLVRSGSGLQSGLGGKVAFRRRLPGRDFQIYGSLVGAFGHAEEQDASLAVEGRRLRLAGRYRRNEAWQDADGRTFEDLYGYQATPDGKVGEIQAAGAWDTGGAVATFESARDVLFPYLRMDERNNDHYQASVSYRDHRLYFNHNDHFMDNALRTSAAMTDMRTDATNTMLGLTGDFYEVYTRNWDADNTITPTANPIMGTVNRMLPDVWRLYASLHEAVGDPDGLELSVRLGLANTSVSDKSQADRYAQLYPDAELDTWSVPFGATLAHTLALSGAVDLGLSAEVASDAASIEELYILVDKPGLMPTWLGNPELSDPLRTTVRAALQQEYLRCELFGSRLWNYPYLVKRSVDGDIYQTYDGIGALLAGVNVGLDWTYLAGGFIWNWGEKTADSSPLAEIQPLTLNLEGRTPALGPARAWVYYEHAAKQGRVDLSLNESATDAWDRVDVGVDLTNTHWNAALVVENVFNELYAQHLSFLRDPFSSGVTIIEPGRTLRVTATFHY